MYAADAIIKAKRLGDYSAGALRYYDIMIEDSFVGKDLKTYRHFPEFLNNPRIFQNIREWSTASCPMYLPLTATARNRLFLNY